jgi:DNA-directed RNA polymerase subunit RPC12/RpoP
MPKSHLVSGFIPVTRKNPRCPACASRMLFVRLVPGSAGFDLHTYECATCDRVHKVIVAADPFKIQSPRLVFTTPRFSK